MAGAATTGATRQAPDGASLERSSATDGRLARGEARRQQIVAATLRVIDAEGSGAVSQRRVATEAGISPASLLYHFGSVDEMLEAALVSVNTAYLAQLDEVRASGRDPLEAFAEMVCHYGDATRESAVAEFELYRSAMNVPRLRDEALSWWVAAEALLEPVVPQPVRRRAIVGLADGISMRCLVEGTTPDLDVVLALFRHLATT